MGRPLFRERWLKLREGFSGHTLSDTIIRIDDYLLDLLCGRIFPFNLKMRLRRRISILRHEVVLQIDLPGWAQFHS